MSHYLLLIKVRILGKLKMEKSVRFSASLGEQFCSDTKFLWQTVIVTPCVLLIMQFINIITINWLIFCTCLIFIAYLKFPEPKPIEIILEFRFNLMWFWEPIDLNMLPNNCMSSLYSWVNTLYAFLMYEILCFTVYLLCWIKCMCASNRSMVTTGANLKAL